MVYRGTGHPSSHLQRHTPLFALSLNVMLMCVHIAALHCVPFTQYIRHPQYTHTCMKVDKRKSTSPIIRGMKSLKFKMLFIYIWQRVLVFTVTWFKVCAQVHSCGRSTQRFTWKTDLTLKSKLLHVFCRHGKCQHTIHRQLLEVYGYCVISR
jgi:hypothetical protein